MPAINACPNLTLSVRMSDSLYGLICSARLWNKHARTALRAELEKHHQKRIPRHFEMGAHQVYQYAPRTKATRRKKREFWHVPPDLDLVRSGATRTQIKSMHSITLSGQFGGHATGGQLIGRLNMWLPFPASRRGKPNSVTQEEIINEITAITEDEARELTEGYRDRLVDEVNSHHGPTRTVPTP